MQMNNRVLVVEDNTVRNRWFSDHCNGRTTICTTTARALDELKNGAYFDIVFHDFDSGPNMWNGGETGDTFDAVANRLAELRFKGLVVIHSLNPAGAERMKQTFYRAGVHVEVYPYGSFDIKVDTR